MRSVALSPADPGTRAGRTGGDDGAWRRARHPGRRRRRRRRGCRPRRRHPRPDRRAGRGPRLRLRHVEPLEQAHPRRPALPRDARLPARGRGAAGARAAIQKLAPHLIKPVPFVYPLQRRGWERLYAGSGVALYDTLGLLSGRARGVPHHRHLTRRGARRIVPALKKDALVGALQYYDAQVDDARHTMFIARTAAAYGAHVASRARVVGLPQGGRAGRRRPGARPGVGPRVRRPGPAGRQRHRRVDGRDAGAGR